jgi:hypothetical protein
MDWSIDDIVDWGRGLVDGSGNGDDGSGNGSSGVQASDLIALLIGLGGAEGWFDDGKANSVGYQGEIPKYTAVRDQVPINWDAYYPENQRRPGEYGQRYFSDTTFAQQPDTQTPTVDQAQASTDTQVAQLAQKNANRGGFAGGGIVEAMSNLRGAGVQKQPKPLTMPPQAQGMPQRPMMPPQAQGIAQAGQFQRGPTDGMADQVPARIDGQQPAQMSHGEFVMPADVVSHLGNGNTDAGAKQLEDMMARIRQARTGSPEQGNRINPNSFIPT